MKKLLLLSLVLASFSCKTMQPALSISESDLLESHPVKGRQGLLINQRLKFGEYETSRVKRSWTRGGNTRLNYPFGTIADPTYPNLISMDYVARNQAYYFQMSDAYGNISDVYGISDYKSQDLQIGDNPNSIINILQDIFGKTDYAENLFYLQFYLNDERRPWQLLLDNHAAAFFIKEYQGVFALNEKTYFTLKPITKVMGKKGPEEVWAGNMGFEIFNSSDESVAAVSLVDGGNVYFHTKDPKERFIVANLSAALLLQQDVTE